MAEDAEAKPVRLYFPTYLQMIHNSVGTAMFRSFYIEDEAGEGHDALGNGENSCAFYVSSVLTLFRKLEHVHGTVENTIKDLQTSGWQIIEDESAIKPGDILVWEPKIDANGSHAHIGFALEKDRAVSTSTSQKVVAQHDLHFGSESRAITAVYRMSNWG